jgi:hypothetical protein
MRSGEDGRADDVDLVARSDQRLSSSPSRCWHGSRSHRPGQSLRDRGVNLYRFLGAIAGGIGQTVGLENCHSLDVMLLPSVVELRARRLRAVIPTPGK